MINVDVVSTPINIGVNAQTSVVSADITALTSDINVNVNAVSVDKVASISVTNTPILVEVTATMGGSTTVSTGTSYFPGGW